MSKTKIEPTKKQSLKRNGAISTGQAKKLILNYMDNKIGRLIAQNETRAVWFSKEDVLEALKPVNGVTPSGLRFYFAAYESYEEGRVPHYWQDSNKITLVIVPTRATNKLGHTVNHPYRKVDPHIKDIIHFDLLKDPGEQPHYDGLPFTETNDGQICPPPNIILPEEE